MLISAIAALAIQDLAARPADIATAAEAPAYAQSVRATALALAALRNGNRPCPDGTVVASLGVTPMGPAAKVLGVKSGDPVAADAAVYKEHVHVTGCGTLQRKDNVLVMRQKAGGWLALPMLPGDSLVTPVQQHDAVQSAVQITQLAEPRPVCGPGVAPYRLEDTFVVDASQRDKGTWTERWVQRACGEDRSVEVFFTPRPDGKATSVVVKQLWPVANPPAAKPQS